MIEQNSQFNFFDTLPKDAVGLIFQQLPDPDRCNMLQTNTRIHNLFITLHNALVFELNSTFSKAINFCAANDLKTELDQDAQRALNPTNTLPSNERVRFKALIALEKCASDLNLKHRFEFFKAVMSNAPQFICDFSSRLKPINPADLQKLLENIFNLFNSAPTYDFSQKIAELCQRLHAPVEALNDRDLYEILDVLIAAIKTFNHSYHPIVLTEAIAYELSHGGPCFAINEPAIMLLEELAPKLTDHSDKLDKFLNAPKGSYMILHTQMAYKIFRENFASPAILNRPKITAHVTQYLYNTDKSLDSLLDKFCGYSVFAHKNFHNLVEIRKQTLHCDALKNFNLSFIDELEKRDEESYAILANNATVKESLDLLSKADTCKEYEKQLHLNNVLKKGSDEEIEEAFNYN